MLKTCVQVARPSESKVVSLTGTRDNIPPGRQMYELQLSYTFSLPKTADTTLNLSALSEVLYESQLESQLWMLYDGNKRLLGCGDAYPAKWSLKLEKGEYTVRASVRHEKRDLVEKFTETPLLVGSKLSSPAQLEVYTSHAQAQQQGKKMTGVTVQPGRLSPLYIGPLASDKYSKGATLGQYLQRTATFARDEVGKKAAVYTFKYILPEGGKKKDKSNKDKDKKKEDLAAYEEAVRDCKISWLSKLSYQSPEAEALYTELRQAEEGNGSPALTSIHLARLTNMLAGEKEDKKWIDVLELAETAVQSVDQAKLLAFLGMKSDVSENAGEQKKENDKLLAVYTDIAKYSDLTDSKVFSFMWKLYRHLGLYGKAVKLAVKQLDEKQTKENEKILVDLLKCLGWDHVVRMLELGRPARYPVDFQPF